MSAFMITDGQRYIKRDNNGRFVAGSKGLGDTFEDEEKAKNVLRNCIKQSERNKYHIEEIKDSGRAIKNTCGVKIVDHIEENVPSSVADDFMDDEFDKWVSSLEYLSKFSSNVSEQLEALKQAQSDVDQEIADIHHYIELKSLNAYQGWVACQMLKIRLEKRRKIKDKLATLQLLSNCKFDSEMFTNVISFINGRDSRKYRPNKLDVLFK